MQRASYLRPQIQIRPENLLQDQHPQSKNRRINPNPGGQDPPGFSVFEGKCHQKVVNQNGLRQKRLHFVTKRQNVIFFS